MENLPSQSISDTHDRDSTEIILQVTDPTVQEAIFKYTMYKVKGEDGYGPFDVPRRYKDFSSLREALVRSWPAVFIPALPPKKAIVKTES